MTMRTTAGLAAPILALAFAASCTTDPRQPDPKAAFVGSEKCGACHVEEYRTWKSTLHAKMIRTPREALLKDAGDNWAKDSKGNAGPTKGNIDAKPATMADVQLVVGSRWKQRYLVKNPATGNLQFMDKQWNTVHMQWEPYGQKNDWETQCATCHATGYRLTSYDPANPAAQKVAMSEHNTGCESCHGPGSAHASALGKRPMFNPAKATKEQSSLVCGYCHVRKENLNFKTAQGNVREDQPHPVVGESYKAGQDDWRTWYPDKMLIPGVAPSQPMSKNYPNTDLNNAFFLDEKAQKWNSFDARKHHQEYQDYLQSAHYQKGLLACADCHSPHGVPGKAAIEPIKTCAGCHGNTYDPNKIMPGLASTAQNLFVRSHTFTKNQDRPSGPTATGMKEPAYYYAK
jgi:nitrate/TMAO reductase-like tetraheme cytochrome c subunit